MMLAALAAVMLAQTTFPSTETTNESPRNMMLEIKLGSYYPWVDRPLVCVPNHQLTATTTGPVCPYQNILQGAMLLVELEVERQLFQAFGSASVGLLIGYGEKYGRAIAQGMTTTEATSLRVLPMRALATYRFDWAAIKYGVPLVPYVKLGFQVVHWWTSKGTNIEVSQGTRGAGWTYGIVGTLGLAFQLDVLDRRLARDFDTGMGVNHTYLFGEYNIAEVNNFGQKESDGVTASALDLSARYFMFGVAFEY